MRYLILFTILFMPIASYAEGVIYEKCKLKLQSKFSGERLEEACLCSQETTLKHVLKYKKKEKEKLKKAISECFSETVQDMVQTTVYKKCMDNKKEAGITSYRRYCGCISENYSTELAKNTSDLVIDKENRRNISDKAMASATQICLPQYVLPGMLEKKMKQYNYKEEPLE